MFDLQLAYMSMTLREKLNIIRLGEINSTNLYAKNNLSELSDKSVIIAKHQTNGRGRFNRVWVDLGDDNLFVSIILKPDNKFQKVYQNLTQYLSVVLAETIETYGLHPNIKWPNDVIINGKKIAGILCETVMQGKNFKGLILGIGINVNALKHNLSLVTDKEITALNIELNKEHVDCEEFFEKLLDKFFKNYENFLNTGFISIKNYYLDKACFLNKDISVRIFNEEKSGFAKTINDYGELVLEKDGEDIILTMGDIL